MGCEGTISHDGKRNGTFQSHAGTTSCIYAELLLVGCLSCTYLFEISHPAAVKSLGIHGSVGLDPFGESKCQKVFDLNPKVR